MASPFNYPPPGGAPNVNSSNPLRPFYGVPVESPLQSSYHHLELLEDDFAAQQHYQQELNSQAVTRQMLRVGAIKFATLALSLPFENAHTLLQVQYMPTDEYNANEDESEDSRADQVREQ